MVVCADILLIARVHVEGLASAGRWHEACELSERVLLLTPPADVARLSSCALAEVGALLALLMRTRTLIGDREHVRDVAGALLASPASPPASLANGVAALRSLVDDDLPSFISHLCALGPRRDDDGTLLLLDALVPHIDERMALSLLDDDALSLGRSVRAGLGSAQEARRAAALSLCGRLVLAAPMALCPRLTPILTTAAVYDTAPLQQLALAILADLAHALADAPPDHPRAASFVPELHCVPTITHHTLELLAPRSISCSCTRCVRIAPPFHLRPSRLGTWQAASSFYAHSSMLKTWYTSA